MEQKFINLKTEMDNYIEKFKLEFDLAQTDDVKEELLVNLLDPIGNLFGDSSKNNKSNCDCKTGGKVIDTIYVVIDRTK